MRFIQTINNINHLKNITKKVLNYVFLLTPRTTKRSMFLFDGFFRDWLYLQVYSIVYFLICYHHFNIQKV
jgi:hypothetical protein